jgi:hypothetical protein
MSTATSSTMMTKTPASVLELYHGYDGLRQPRIFDIELREGDESTTTHGGREDENE